MFRWQIDLNDRKGSRAFALTNLDWYQSIDWALDITEAKFSFIEALIGVPPRLIRRNPDAHFILTRLVALDIRSAPERFGVWSSIAEDLLESGLDATAVVVGGTGKKLQTDLDDARELRAQGVLE